ncbi:hypothetical protein EJB05_57063 [Eragrostis curvula]|uniref:Uncharacterized protein n=1 Tax=Eragrostis curvula TaxID=38414 RepID=A0A5J9SEE3_9POAL|nr:hypothetical protein EJB05_57063 [Eragrostis curvula]
MMKIYDVVRYLEKIKMAIKPFEAFINIKPGNANPLLVSKEAMALDGGHLSQHSCPTSVHSFTSRSVMRPQLLPSANLFSRASGRKKVFPADLGKRSLIEKIRKLTMEVAWQAALPGEVRHRPRVKIVQDISKVPEDMVTPPVLHGRLHCQGKIAAMDR